MYQRLACLFIEMQADTTECVEIDEAEPIIDDSDPVQFQLHIEHNTKISDIIYTAFDESAAKKQRDHDR